MGLGNCWAMQQLQEFEQHGTCTEFTSCGTVINTRHFTCLDTPASGYKPLPASAALPTRNRSSHSHYCIPIHVFQRSYSRGHRRRRRIGQDVRIVFVRIKKVQWLTRGGSAIHSSSLREAQMSSSTTLTPLLPKRW